MTKPCVKCNFDNDFTTDYEADGTEFVFCLNCGTRVKEDDHEKNSAQQN
jgi:Zn ribbon nucleic-acid-binding protein